jgi:O-antigen/teichoic acid export membrane protein
VVRSAGLTAGVVLATGFAHGVIRGAGRVRLAAGLPVAQAAIYLVAVTLWAGSTPERVFAAMAASYGMSLLVSLPICRPLFEACLRIGLRARAPIRRVVSSSSPVYLLSLLLAPFASIAVIGLGAAGRFGDAALFSAALTLALALSTALSLVVSVQYFPRACVLAASGEDGAAWFDRFYRPFASLGVAVAAMQVVFPGDAIVALFTNRYVGGADVLRSLAGVGAFLALGQLAVWTLFAHGRVRFALFGTGTQLTVLLAWVVLVIHLPALPLWVLGDGHVVAAASGLAVCALGINRLDRSYRLHARRLAAALLTVIAAEIGLRDLMLAVYAGRYLPIGALVVATLIGTLIAATVLMSELLARLWRQAGEDQR